MDEEVGETSYRLLSGDPSFRESGGEVGERLVRRQRSAERQRNTCTCGGKDRGSVLENQRYCSVILIAAVKIFL